MRQEVAFIYKSSIGDQMDQEATRTAQEDRMRQERLELKERMRQERIEQEERMRQGGGAKRAGWQVLAATTTHSHDAPERLAGHVWAETRRTHHYGTAVLLCR